MKPQQEITPQEVYFNRRAVLRAGVLGASVLGTGWVYRKLNAVTRESAVAELPPLLRAPATKFSSANTQATSAPVEEAVDPKIARAFVTDEPRTPYEDITNYNNFYEFSTDKEGVAPAAKGFVTRPWTIEVTGLARKAKLFDIDDILAFAPPEERVYRMRCVEAWSMVIPWNGFSLSKLLSRVEPLSSAKYVAFTTLLDPKRMPNQRGRVLDWPYVEGLRMDEAMHPLTILASGIYGRQLPGQDGAPLRLVVPWKYGFKGIKSIVKIELTDKQPPTTWGAYAPNEYGFYANVNPQVDHPRWSQASERRLGVGRRDTLMFNGYAEQVGHLYAGMDLRANF
jgi:sulfoxide reductase catalytic subunit YedY